MGNDYTYGLVLHANGNLYITEDNYVRIIDMKTSKTIITIGKKGSGDKEFNRPSAIAILGDYMYIADCWTRLLTVDCCSFALNSWSRVCVCSN